MRESEKEQYKEQPHNGEVRRALSEIIRDVKDPRVDPFCSIVEVIVAPDLKTCKVYVSVLGDEAAAKENLEGLRSAEGFIRRELAHTLNLRNTPELKFINDDSIRYGVEMTKKIEEIIQTDENRSKQE